MDPTPQAEFVHCKDLGVSPLDCVAVRSRVRKQATMIATLFPRRACQAPNPKRNSKTLTELNVDHSKGGRRASGQEPGIHPHSGPRRELRAALVSPNLLWW